MQSSAMHYIFLPERIGCVGVVIVGGKSAVEFRLGEPEIIHTTGT